MQSMPLPPNPAPDAPAALLAALATRFGERFNTARAVREQHGRDESPFDVPPPSGVVFCETTDDVADCVRLCAAHGTPAIAFGAGSSLEGQLLAVRGGISVDLSRMHRVLDVAAEDMLATVQAGVTRLRLNDELRHTGLFFPIDPGADASLGGMTATRASGTNAVRYGTMRENVLALTVVLGDGRVVRTGTRARKSSAGYDLTRLFVGSEGTLGIITEVTVRLHPLPAAAAAAVCSFASVTQAVNCTITTIQAGIPIARCELMDANAVRAVNAHDRLQLPETPLLLMEFHGSAASVREQAEAVQAIAAEHGGSDFAWADAPEERTRLWKARHHAYLSALQTRPGSRCVTTDACVPLSRLAECVDAAIEEAQADGLPYFIVGHVGDGNFHVGYLIDPARPGERDRAERLNASLVRRALGVGGTCTGEHGVGLHKQDFLLEEAGADTVGLMRALKHAFDPQGILNPGKIFA